MRQYEPLFRGPHGLTVCLWMCLLAKTQENNLVIENALTSRISICYSRVGITFIAHGLSAFYASLLTKCILPGTFPLEGSIFGLGIIIPTSEGKHFICIISCTILPYNLCDTSFFVKLGHLSGGMVKSSLLSLIILVLNRDQCSKGVIDFFFP